MYLKVSFFKKFASTGARTGGAAGLEITHSMHFHGMVIIPCSHINLNLNSNPNQRFICHVNLMD